MKWDVKWWPTGAQWAYRQQHAYWDSADGCPFEVEHALSHYAEPGEIATLVAQLKQLYHELGREMRAAKLQAGPLLRQPGELGHDYSRRVLSLSRAEHDLWCEPLRLRDDRRMIADVLRGIANNNVPLQARYQSLHGKTKDLVTPINDRYQNAWKAAREKWEQKHQQPIDDAAWGRELERRAQVEQKYD